ncbi:abc transporter C family protein, partial [Naegleria gruberi]
YFFATSKIWIPLIGALQGSILQKLNRIKSVERRKFKSGELNNLFAIDTRSVAMDGIDIHEAWLMPLTLIVGIVLVFVFFGYSSLVGVLAMIICGPVLPFLGKYQTSFAGKAAQFRDERIKHMSEILNGIRIVKFYVFEDKMKEKVNQAREKEYSLLRKYVTVMSGYCFTSSLMAIVGSGATFVTFYYAGGDLTLPKMFTGLVLFGTFRLPLLHLPWAISNLVFAYVSAKRIGRFLFSEDTEKLPHDHENKANLWEFDEEQTEFSSIMDNDTAIECKDASIGWSEEEAPTLTDLNLKIERGKLYCVIGNTGSGKSTLISSIYGESVVKSGKVKVNPLCNISLSDETPWLINASVRENIVFDKNLTFDRERYNRILDVCQLRDDLSRFPNYDKTEIGFSGINLSGGQKHRISLARACYSNSEIVLMDSTLNSIDAKLCRKIFNECICGFLKDRTRILVTHSLQLLEMADEVIVFENGKLIAKGSLKEIKNSYDFSKLISEEKEESETEENEVTEKDMKQDEKKGQLVAAEDKSYGEVSWSVFMTYIRRCGIFLTVISLLLNVMSMGAKTASQVWISVMNSDMLSLPLVAYVWVFFSFGLMDCFIIFFKELSLGFATLKGSNNLHRSMLNNILRAPIQFFDQNPVGRILNRFTQDLETLDNMVMFASDFISNVLNIIFTLTLISVINPMFLIVVVPIGFAFYIIQEYYRTTSRELRRLESISKSPVMSHFNSCLEGVNTVKASLVHSNIYEDSFNKIDFANKHTFNRFMVNRWLGVRIHLISQSVLFFTAIFAIIAKHTQEISSPAFLVLTISNSLQLSDCFQSLVRSFVEVESNMTCVERIVYYAQSIPQEAAYDKEGDPTTREWPTKGHIQLDQLSVRYRDDLDPVLKNLDLDIKAGTKVGVVGRTGSGKSTLLISLFRFLEANEGSISIDGLDISNIGLRTLRKALLIIPQQPVLFSGSIRYNLDPFDEFEDYEIWNALERVHMKEKIQPLQLSFTVTENGSNFSIGERQLLSLSRCILRKANIIIFDESTAFVDHNSDELVQKVVREEFKDSTIITVAHRLDTIIDSDCIVFMKEGEIIETGSPKELLLDERSNFSSLVRETGKQYSDHLKNKAFKLA